MVNLQYLPALKRFDQDQIHQKRKVDLAKTCVQEELQGERDLLDQLWIFVNPEQQSEVEKAVVFDYLLLLMFNVCH